MDFTDDEKWLLRHIIETGGEDYDVWPAIDSRLMPVLNSLQDRGVVSIMDNGDIKIVIAEVYEQINGLL